MSQPMAGQPGFLLPTEAYSLGAAPVGVYLGRTVGRFVGAFLLLAFGLVSWSGRGSSRPSAGRHAHRLHRSLPGSRADRR